MGWLGQHEAVSLDNPVKAGISSALTCTIPWFMVGALIKVGRHDVGMFDVVVEVLLGGCMEVQVVKVSALLVTGEILQALII